MSKKKINNDRLIWLDLVRVLAIFLMVVLHVSAGYVPLWFEQSSFGWWVANSIDSLSRVCVPWLIMLSGALLLPQAKKTNWPLFYRKRLGKLFRPWLFWSVIFGMINLWQGNDVSTIKRLVVGTVWTGFWLLPVFLGLYLATPWLMKFKQKLGNFWLWPMIALGLWMLVSGVHLPLYFEYVVFFLLGDILAKLPVKKVWQKLSFVGMISGWSLVAILTHQLSLINQSFDPTYYQFNSWPVVLMSISGFWFFSQMKHFWQEKISQNLAQWLTKLGAATFQLYFIHLLFFRLPFRLITLPGIIFIPLYSLLVFGGSWLGVWLLKKNKLLAKLSGAEERYPR